MKRLEKHWRGSLCLPVRSSPTLLSTTLFTSIALSRQAFVKVIEKTNAETWRVYAKAVSGNALSKQLIYDTFMIFMYIYVMHPFRDLIWVRTRAP